jgi:2-dehydro-3-deoxygluconokinase
VNSQPEARSASGASAGTGHARVELVTAGEVMTLVLAEPPELLRSATRLRRSLAGAESNVAIGLARLGVRSRWIGVLGDDPLGDAALATLRGEGVDVAFVRRDPDAPTGVLLRDAPLLLPIQVVYHRSAAAGARLGPEDIPPEAVAGARMVHVTGITAALSPSCAAAAATLAKHGREAGAEVVLDPNYRSRLWSIEDARSGVETLAGLADVVLVGEEEGRLLTGGSEPSALAGWFLDRGAALVVVKRGAQGAWATDGDEVWAALGFAVDPVDVVGAGDAFAAAFLAGRLAGHAMVACLRAGNAAGAAACRAYGDIEGLPTAAELTALLDGAGDVAR